MYRLEQIDSGCQRANLRRLQRALRWVRLAERSLARAAAAAALRAFRAGGSGRDEAWCLVGGPGAGLSSRVQQIDTAP